jgi:hypothetical protein
VRVSALLLGFVETPTLRIPEANPNLPVRPLHQLGLQSPLMAA